MVGDWLALSWGVMDTEVEVEVDFESVLVADVVEFAVGIGTAVDVELILLGDEIGAVALALLVAKPFRYHATFQMSGIVLKSGIKVRH